MDNENNDESAKSNIWLYASLILIFLLLISLYNMNQMKTRLMDAYVEKDNLYELYDKLLNIKASHDADTMFIPGISKSGLKQLSAKGLTNPVKEIRLDLMQNSQLIPDDAVLGGKMGFYDPAAIYIMNEKWVYAYFEDGHISGYALLEYDVDNGTISWSYIDSKSDEH